MHVSNLRVDVSGLNLGRARILQGDIVEALTEKAGPIILARSNELAPKESGDLIASGKVNASRGGNATIAVEYTSVYAHWIHEHLWFRHPHGGGAKFLEKAMTEKGANAIEAAARSLL